MINQIKILFSISLSLAILMNSIGNVSLFLSLLKGIPAKRQKQIVLRELIISLFVIILFYFIGGVLLNFLNITQDILQIASGVILFLLSSKMLFPTPAKEKQQEELELKKITEPFIVPLAVPLVAGPAVLSAVMLYSTQVLPIIMLGSIVVAWLASLSILLLSAHLSKFLGKKGIVAMERIMGFIMVLISLQMFFNGLKSFMKS